MKNKILIAVFLLLFCCSIGFSLYFMTENNSLAEENLKIRNQQNADKQLILEFQNNQVEYEKLISELKTEISEAEKKSMRDTTKYESILNGKLNIINDSIDLGYYPEQELNGNYSIESAINNQNRIKEIFLSFIKLTKKVEQTLTDTEKNEIGNMDWSIQMIGFNNIGVRIEIAIREMRYVISKLEFEIAILKYKNGEIDEENMDMAEESYITDRDKYVEYANYVGFAD